MMVRSQAEPNSDWAVHARDSAQATGRGRFYVLGNQIVNGLDPPVVKQPCLLGPPSESI